MCVFIYIYKIVTHSAHTYNMQKETFILITIIRGSPKLSFGNAACLGLMLFCLALN